MKHHKFKKHLKEKVRKATYEELTKMKEKHSKVNQISYNSLSIQNDLTDAKFTHKEKQLLFKLRSKMIDVKGNFKNMYLGNLECSLCRECDIQTQDHLLVCQKIISNK